MNKIILTILLITISFSINAQQFISINNNSEGGLRDSIIYYASGVIKSKGSYNKEGKEEGEWLDYSYLGKLETKGYFKNGVIHGEWIHYYYSGGINYKYNCIYGKIVGPMFHYNENGDLIYSEEFLKGSPIKEYIEYFKNGKIKSKGYYIINNKCSEENGFVSHQHSNGFFLTYYESGQLQTKESYINGLKNGVTQYYKIDGKLDKIETYLNDTLEECIMLK